MLRFFIIANFFFLYVPIFGTKGINKIIEYSSLWNWIPQAHQANFFNMKKKKTQFKILFCIMEFFFAPFLYTGYQIQKRIKSTYNNNSSIFELFFNYQKDKQTTNINHILIDFFKNQERKNFFCLNIIECINKALREENKYDNYVTYYKTYLKEFSKKINKKFKSLLHATNKKYFLETILFHFTWELIRLKDRYNLDELKIKLEEKLQREVLPNNEEELEKIYGVIQQITKHPHIDFLAKKRI